MTNGEIREILKQPEQKVKRNYIDLITRTEITATMMRGLLLALEEATDETISTDIIATALKLYIKELEL